MAFLVDELSAGRDRKETSEDVMYSLRGYAAGFLKACHEFQQMLLWANKVAEHVY